MKAQSYSELMDLLLANPILSPEQKRFVIGRKNRRKLSKLDKVLLKSMYRRPIRLELVK